MNNNIRLMMSGAVAAGLVLSLVLMFSVFSPTTVLAKDNAGHGSDQLQKFKISGKVAQAAWSIDDEETETYTDVAMFLVDSQKNVLSGYPQSSLDIIISQYKLVEVCEVYDGEKYCYYDYEPIMEFYGFTEPSESHYAISNNLRSASLDHVSVTGYDYVSGDEKTITIDALWSGEGNQIKIKQSYSETNEFYKISFNGMGTGRDATASADISGDLDISLDPDSNSDSSLLKFREAYKLRIIEEPY